MRVLAAFLSLALVSGCYIKHVGGKHELSAGAIASYVVSGMLCASAGVIGFVALGGKDVGIGGVAAATTLDLLGVLGSIVTTAYSLSADPPDESKPATDPSTWSADTDLTDRELTVRLIERPEQEGKRTDRDAHNIEELRKRAKREIDALEERLRVLEKAQSEAAKKAEPDPESSQAEEAQETADPSADPPTKPDQEPKP